MKNCFYKKTKKSFRRQNIKRKVLKHAIEIFENQFGKSKYSGYVQVTEPFRPKNILDDCFKKINLNMTVAFAAAQYKNYWSIKKKNILTRLTNFKDRKKPRQIKKPILREDTGIALATKSYYLRKGERIGNKVTCVIYDNPRYNIDINELEDLKLARKIL